MPDVLNTGYRIADLGIATVGAVVSPMTALAENFSESIMRERLLSSGGLNCSRPSSIVADASICIY